MGERDDRPEGVLSTRAEGALAVLVPPTWPGPGAVSDAPFVEGLDLDEERALHEEMKRRRADPPHLGAATEAVLRAQLLGDSRPRVA